MQTIPESWTAHIHGELDRYIAALFEQDGTRYRCGITDRTISKGEFLQIRNEVIANATTDSTSLAYQMLVRSGPNMHSTVPCLTCDAAVRLAWGASATRRLLGLPATNDVM
jgi:hypothetical protein